MAVFIEKLCLNNELHCVHFNISYRILINFINARDLISFISSQAFLFNRYV